MAVFRLKDLRGMSNEDLEDKMRELKTQLSRERGAISAGTKPENPGKVREVRRTIAKILTIINESKKETYLYNYRHLILPQSPIFCVKERTILSNSIPD